MYILRIRIDWTTRHLPVQVGSWSICVKLKSLWRIMQFLAGMGNTMTRLVRCIRCWLEMITFLFLGQKGSGTECPRQNKNLSYGLAFRIDWKQKKNCFSMVFVQATNAASMVRMLNPITIYFMTVYRVSNFWDMLLIGLVLPVEGGTSNSGSLGRTEGQKQGK